jgi:hypothetical protein
VFQTAPKAIVHFPWGQEKVMPRVIVGGRPTTPNLPYGGGKGSFSFLQIGQSLRLYKDRAAPPSDYLILHAENLEALIPPSPLRLLILWTYFAHIYAKRLHHPRRLCDAFDGGTHKF